MIEISKSVIDITGLFSTFVFNPNYKFNIKISTSLGVSLPTIQLELSTKTFSLVEELYNGKIFTVKINSLDLEFRIGQYNYTNNKVTILGYLNKYDFINKSIQFALEGTSVDLVNSITTLNVIDKGVVSNDSQVWINPNKTEKEFVRSLLTHSYISDTDFLLSHITYEGELVLTSYETVIEESPSIILGNKPGQYKYDELRIESVPTSYQNSIVNRIGVSTQDASANTYSNDNTGEVPSYVTINSGNVHDNFFSSPTNITKRVIDLFNKTYMIALPALPEPENISVGAIVDIKTSPQEAGSNKIDILDYSTLITATDLIITNDKISNLLYLNRIL